MRPDPQNTESWVSDADGSNRTKPASSMSLATGDRSPDDPALDHARRAAMSIGMTLLIGMVVVAPTSRSLCRYLTRGRGAGTRSQLVHKRVGRTRPCFDHLDNHYRWLRRRTRSTKVADTHRTNRWIVNTRRRHPLSQDPRESSNWGFPTKSARCWSPGSLASSRASRLLWELRR